MDIFGYMGLFFLLASAGGGGMAVILFISCHSYLMAFLYMAYR